MKLASIYGGLFGYSANYCHGLEQAHIKRIIIYIREREMVTSENVDQSKNPCQQPINRNPCQPPLFRSSTNTVELSIHKMNNLMEGINAAEIETTTSVSCRP